MDENIDPIYDFGSLRNFLIQKGYIVEKGQAYREIRPEEVTVDSISKGEIEFTDEGIYVMGSGNERQQVYLYKRDYHLTRYGKPRFHICKCATIEEFINSGGFREHYVRANSDSVPVKDMDNAYKEVMVKELQLCRNCFSKIQEYGSSINSSQFVEILRQARGESEESETHEVDIFGYTRDWDDISRKYREKHEYTCEECGLRIDNPYDRQYIHVHHMDANKLNNKETNLKCLCLRCHSSVDKFHRKNLREGANKFVWEAFNAAYPENTRNINPHISKL